MNRVTKKIKTRKILKFRVESLKIGWSILPWRKTWKPVLLIFSPVNATLIIDATIVDRKKGNQTKTKKR